MNRISFSLKPLPPFRLDYTVWVLRRRPDNLWDGWDGRTYRRVLVLNDRPVCLGVSQTGPREDPTLRVAAEGTRLGADLEPRLTSLLERVLGLRADLAGFARLARKDSRLQPLAQRFLGMKPPRYPTVFEALVNAVTCQQFTLTAGLRVLARLVRAHGMAYPKPGGELRAFPRPRDLAGLETGDLKALGYSRQKAQSVIELARSCAAGALDPEGLDSLSDAEALERLTGLWGVGRWTAEYALLRGLGRVHVFPGDDVGVRNRLQAWMGTEKPLDYAGVRRTLKRWEPYGGLIYFLLLLQGLGEAGDLWEED